jgi:uncharacterized protein YkwD
MSNRNIFLFSILFTILITGCTSKGQITPQSTMRGSISTPSATIQAGTIPFSKTLVPQSSSSSSSSIPALTDGTSAMAAQTTPEPTLTQLVPTSELPTPTPTNNPTIMSTPVEITTPTEISITPIPIVDNSGCTDQASFESDVTVPDNTTFHQGDQFVKTWRLYNSGTCTWGSGYELVLAYGDPMNASASNPLPTVPPGTIVNVSLNMTAPAGAGEHTGNWQLQNAAGKTFGVGSANDNFWVKINVSYIAPEVTPTSEGQTASGDAIPTPTPTTTITTGGCSYSRNPDFEDQVLQQINTVRASHNLDALTLNPQLSAAAFTYSQDMACNNRVDFNRHTDSQGGRWYDRITAQDYSYTVAYENVYVGNPAYSGGSPQSAMVWWMQSPIHMANILRTDITEIGIAYVYTAKSDYGGYYTTDFGSPK